MSTGSGSAPSALHGGRVQAARKLFPDAPGPFVDLSTGINPCEFPLPPLPPSAFTRLPEPEDEMALRVRAAAAYGAPGAEFVVAAPGSQILISLLPVLLRCRRAVVLGPTYGEHAEAWAASGTTVDEVTEADALAARAAPGTALILCNPNNPDGRRLSAAGLASVAARAAQGGATLVVDEAFADLEPDVPQAAALLPSPGLVVLRSFGKTYGLAGIRLGFMLAAPALAARVRTLLGPWAISGAAIACGCRALPDQAWRHQVGIRLAGEVARLDRLLEHAGLVVVGGTRLFRLAESPDAQSLFQQLGQAGLLVRRFPTHSARLRFGLPPTEASWRRLEAALLRRERIMPLTAAEAAMPPQSRR